MTEKIEKHGADMQAIVECTIVSSGGAFTGPSVLISLSRKQLLGGEVKPFKRYLFNCCEGFQRACKALKLKLAGIEHLFFTALCSDRFLGLPGLVLGLGDVGASSLTVHGPEGTCEYVSASRPFFPKVWPKVQTIANIPRKTDALVLCDDNFFKIVGIPIGGIPEPPDRASSPRRKKRRTSCSDEVDPPLILYICEGKGDALGNKFVFVECCVSNNWVHRVSFWIKTFHSDCQKIYHFFPPAGVPSWQLEDYKAQWMVGDEGEDKHIFLIRESSLSVEGDGMFASSNRFQAELHGISSTLFPMPLVETGGEGSADFTYDEIAANAADSIKALIESDSVEPKEPQNDNKQVAAALREHLKTDLPVGGHRPLELVFLGTGSAAPSKLRNSSAIFLRNPNYTIGSILIDVGEGTFAQMLRAFKTPEQVDNAIRSLGLIWISHHHIDHHLGLLRLLERRSQLASVGIPLQPIIIIGPRSVKVFIDKTMPRIARTARYIDFYEYCRLVDVQHIMLQYLGIELLKSIPVIHCRDSFGLVLKLRSGEKIVYSGDTRPCKALAQAGKGATLLIHEATFDDSMIDAAKSKRHSTFSEALSIGADMGAKFIVLTHFSQRYPRSITVGNANRNGNKYEAGTSSGKFVLAFDLMRLEVSGKGLANAVDTTTRLSKYFAQESSKIETNESNE